MVKSSMFIHLSEVTILIFYFLFLNCVYTGYLIYTDMFYLQITEIPVQSNAYIFY